MAEFFRSSRVWVVDFSYEGRARRWLKALPASADADRAMQALLHDLYGTQARLVAVRPATVQEEEDYIRGNLPRNMLCPSGRSPLSDPMPPEDR